MAKLSRTRMVVRRAHHAATTWIGQPEVSPLFAILLAAIKSAAEPATKDAEERLAAADRSAFLRVDGKLVPVLDNLEKPTGRYEFDPEKLVEREEARKVVLEELVEFDAPRVRLSGMISAWEDAQELAATRREAEEALLAEEDLDEEEYAARYAELPKKMRQTVPGWIISAFFEAGLIDYDVESEEVDRALGKEEEEKPSPKKAATKKKR